MCHRYLALLGALAVVIAVVSSAPVPVAGPTSLVSFVKVAEASGEGGQAAASAAKTWPAPRTPWGDPDLQGVWNASGVTPLERPSALAGRDVLTDDEVAELDRDAQSRDDRLPEQATLAPIMRSGSTEEKRPSKRR